MVVPLVFLRSHARIKALGEQAKFLVRSIRINGQQTGLNDVKETLQIDWRHLQLFAECASAFSVWDVTEFIEKYGAFSDSGKAVFLNDFRSYNQHILHVDDTCLTCPFCMDGMHQVTTNSIAKHQLARTQKMYHCRRASLRIKICLAWSGCECQAVSEHPANVWVLPTIGTRVPRFQIL